MGKKSKEKAGGESSGVVTSLFSSDNPFRRKPQSEPSTPPSQPQPQHQKSELPLVPAGGESSNDGTGKRKREKNAEPQAEIELNLGEAGLEILKKKKADVDRVVRSPRKKRKRQEIEEEYEKKKFGVEPEAVGKNGAERRELAVSAGRKRKADDETKDMEVQMESFDDESKLLRTVFVGNLPLKTKKKALLKEFATFGEIASARIRSVPIIDSKTPRKASIIKGKVNDAIDSVHAYIVFKDEQSARAALAHNMAKFGGNHIRVDMACPPRKKMKGEAPVYSVKKTVFVGNLPYDVKDEELYQLFCEDNQLESSLEAVRVVRDPQTSLGKGIAYVLFKTREAANTIVKKKGLKLRDRELRLSHAKPDSTPSKRKKGEKGGEEYPNKRAADASSGRDYKPRVVATSLSYQGLRSSKSGIQKKAPRVDRRHAETDVKGSKPSEGKVRKEKRPAVAARKAKALKEGQKKRKLESGTPENHHRNKKARHFR